MRMLPLVLMLVRIYLIYYKETKVNTFCQKNTRVEVNSNKKEQNRDDCFRFTFDIFFEVKSVKIKR